MIRRLFLSLALSLGFSLAVTAVVRLRELYRTWGRRPEDAGMDLPGDDLVADAGMVDTRSIDIDAPAAEVWPWLVQMGFGRGGWYSYDRMDMLGSSADRILPELQSLAVGDIVPTHPGGGFRVEVIDPERALVLYFDSAMATAQAGVPEAPPLPLQAAGAMGAATMPEFRASWTFALRPLGGHRTRLIERLRLWAPAPGPVGRLGLPMMGFGVFLMTRKQMLGIRSRAERAGAGGGSAAPRTDPLAEGVHTGNGARPLGGVTGVPAAG